MREWLIQVRKDKGMNQSRFAEFLGISKSYLHAIEKGEKTPAGHMAYKIARKIDKPMEWFYKEESSVK